MRLLSNRVQNTDQKISPVKRYGGVLSGYTHAIRHAEYELVVTRMVDLETLYSPHCREWQALTRPVKKKTLYKRLTDRTYTRSSIHSLWDVSGQGDGGAANFHLCLIYDLQHSVAICPLQVVVYVAVHGLLLTS